MKTHFSAAAALTALMTCAPMMAQAQDGPWSLRIGLAGIGFDESATVKQNGAVVPGASFTTDNDASVVFSLGYRFSERFSAEATVGIPPTATLNGSGPLAGLTLGEVTYGPATVTGLYHMPLTEGLEAYVGGGVNDTLVFGTEDAALTNFKVDNAWAPVVQAGLSGAIQGTNTDWFVDVKYIPLKTKATGMVGPNTASADITLNPTIITAGIGINF
ncbi:OmpW/AlkL family protein [Tropicibacter naphthalenivorans]|uniref:Outer membrane protein W n=1 Tax=Tropicibacter naphthalenivorans TaxID=441103 RepID=A0A0P1GHL3_9RHOB|nr:OmpW family outer membrane protein [Tropicibacter naphthalenivorans]CUH81224.1 outer membrane protein W [Tropicibacter naphthalenivorans]SMC97781.1 outer membrane protein [Tropicibacter naphthalenivorans]